MSPAPTRRRTSLGRETWVFLPLAVALLLAVSLFTLLSYRNALELLSDEKRTEAIRWAERLARSPDLGSTRPRIDLPPEGVRALLLEADGTVRAAIGEPLETPPFRPLGGSAPLRSEAVWAPEAESSVVAYAPVPAAVGHEGGARVVRVDLRDTLLARQRRALEILTVVVLIADAAVALWLVLFLRKILSPYEALLATARAHGSRDEDEAEFLLRTLDRALAGPEESNERDPDLEVLRRTLGSSLEEGLLLLDRDGRTLVTNPRAREVLGLAPHPDREAIEVVLAPYPAILDALRRPLTAEEPLPPTEIRVARPDEDDRRLALSVTPLRRLGGELMGFLVLLSDVTSSSRQAEERRLAESLSHLGELSAGVAHELRNGLATLRGYLQLLERADTAEAGRPYLTELDAETRHLERVVSDFLSFARPGTANPEPLDLAALLHRLARRPGAGETELDCAARPVEVLGDPTLLTRAFDNLLRNAREATDLAGSPEPVRVRIERSAGGGRVEVCDRGPGLPDAVRERLFHPFTSTKADGAGLGLALAHRVVALHGGTLQLEDREGGGVRAVVWLPGPAEGAMAEGGGAQETRGRLD